jgi:hypothetical protein
MKDTILNSTLVASLFASMLFSAIGNGPSAAQAPVAASRQVVQLEKTVITAKRVAPDMQLASVAVR